MIIALNQKLLHTKHYFTLKGTLIQKLLRTKSYFISKASSNEKLHQIIRATPNLNATSNYKLHQIIAKPTQKLHQINIYVIQNAQNSQS